MNTKGKTWEEIYGLEEAECRRKKLVSRNISNGRVLNIGDKIGKWTLVEIVRKHRKRYVKAKCECGKEQVLWHPQHLNDNSGCMRCTRAGKNHYKWGGVGELPGTILYRIKSNAKHKGWEVNVTLEYLWELFLKQKRCCALTGRKLSLVYSNTRKFGPLMDASVDRIDSSKGYVIGNVQWVHKDINRLKSDMGQQEFVELCCQVAEYQGKK